MRTFSGILDNVVADMDMSIKVVDVELLAGPARWRCTVGANHYGKTTLTARPTLYITDPDGGYRQIFDVEFDEWFDVPQLSLSELPKTGLWVLDNLMTFVGGTPKSLSSEIAISEGTGYKINFPIVWLMEIMQEKVSYKLTKDVLFTPIAKLFFLDDVNFQSWTRLEHMEQVVIPLRNYADRMIKNMIYTGKFGEPITDPIFINQIRFGEGFLVQGKGGLSSQHISSILTSQTSGVEVRLEIPVKRSECGE